MNQKIVTIVAAVLATVPAAWAQQVQTPTPPPTPRLLSLFTDDKALKVGDVVTVLITQTAQATAKVDRKSTNQVTEDTQRGTGFLNVFPPNRAYQSNYQASAGLQDNSSSSLAATLATTVMEMLPNGNLKIQGSQESVVDGRKQFIKIVGVVRPQDVRPDNTVLSTAITDAKVEFKGLGRGQGTMSRKSGGFFGPILDILKRPFDLLF